MDKQILRHWDRTTPHSTALPRLRSKCIIFWNVISNRHQCSMQINSNKTMLRKQRSPNVMRYLGEMSQMSNFLDIKIVYKSSQFSFSFVWICVHIFLSSTSTIIPSYLLPSLPGIQYFHFANRITFYPARLYQSQNFVPDFHCFYHKLAAISKCQPCSMKAWKKPKQNKKGTRKKKKRKKRKKSANSSCWKAQSSWCIPGAGASGSISGHRDKVPGLQPRASLGAKGPSAAPKFTSCCSHCGGTRGECHPQQLRKSEEGTGAPVGFVRRGAGPCCTLWHRAGWEGSNQINRLFFLDISSSLKK